MDAAISFSYKDSKIFMSGINSYLKFTGFRKCADKLSLAPTIYTLIKISKSKSGVQTLIYILRYR